MEYTIKEGSHYSTCELPGFHRWNNNHFRKYVTFSPDCIHPKGDGFISKLFGISQGFPHQANYLLIGWRYREGQGIELLPYMHVDWVKTYKADDPNPCIIQPGERVFCEIDTTNPDAYVFYVGENLGKRVWIIPRTNKPWFPIGYTLKPYFGGQPVAPHTMHITLENA